MKHLLAVCASLDARREKVLAELHPVLRHRVVRLLAHLGGRLSPWCGYRGPKEQEVARSLGNSNARWLQSPHNYSPALAVDLVLDPRHVVVRERTDSPGFPDLWDEVSPEAKGTWFTLELGAIEARLARVTVGGKRDKPHLELPEWRSFIPG